MLRNAMRRMDGERMARGLGWFSIGLGLAQVAAPARVGRAIGFSGDGRGRLLMRAVGIRELLSGAAILMKGRPVLPLWARVGGDAMDLALLGVPLATGRTERGRTAGAMAAVIGVSALDAFTGARLSKNGHDAGESTAGEAESPARRTKSEVTKKVTVNRAPEEVSRFWREAKDTPNFVPHLTRLAPSVSFAPAPRGRGTEVTVTLPEQTVSMLGKLAATLSKSVPQPDVDRDLRIFKQVLETGEVTQSEATLHGHPHPAIPPSAKDAARARLVNPSPVATAA